MSLGHSPTQPDVFRSTASYCEGRVPEDSIHALLHRECFALFPDEVFADLFTDIGRRSVPPMIVAVVMVLQRLEGLSDREAVERFSFDVRWKYRRGRSRLRPSGLQPYRARGHACPPGPLGAAGAHLRGRPRGRERGRTGGPPPGARLDGTP